MSKETLSSFFKTNQYIIASIALFAGLAAFFIEFFQQNKNEDIIKGSQSVEFLAFISFGVVIFLLVYIFKNLNKIKTKDKSIWIFKILMLLFLAFVSLFMLEYWQNFNAIIRKLAIAIGILLCLLWLYNYSIKKKWIQNIYYLIGTLITQLFVILTTFKILGTKGCQLNEYVSFGLFFFAVSLTFLLFSVIVSTYSKIIDSAIHIKERAGNKKFLLLLIVIAVVLIVAYFVYRFSLKLKFTDLLSNVLIWSINFVTNFVCGK